MAYIVEIVTSGEERFGVDFLEPFERPKTFSESHLSRLAECVSGSVAVTDLSEGWMNGWVRRWSDE